MIEVSGFSVERFVNMAAFRGIYLWNVCPKGAVVQMNVSKTGVTLLEECARKTGCRYEIVEERGLPVQLKHYQKRKILAAGFLFFIIGLYMLSSFVWIVEVQGNERISQEEILSACEDMGLKPGALKFRLNMDKITDRLAESFVDISWVSVSIQGTNATVKLVETIPQPEIVDQETPSNMIAAEDGVILNLAIEAGTPLVKIGDVVEKGDMLVSGEIILKDVDTEVGKAYVRARGAVYAKLWHTLKEELPLEYMERQFTGEVKQDHSIAIKDSVINFVKPKMQEGLYEQKVVYQKNLAIGDFQLPFSVEKEEYKEYIEVKRTRTVEEAKEELKSLLEKKATELAQENREILDISIAYEAFDERVVATATIAVSQRIDEEEIMEDWSEAVDERGEDTAD